VARTQADLDALAPAVALRGDASDPQSLADALDRARSELGPAGSHRQRGVRRAPARRRGGGGAAGAVTQATLDGFEGWTAAVARQAFVFLGAGARALEGRGGTLVQVTGGSARRAIAGRGLWAAGTAALRALTHAAALELREQGTHVALLIADGTIESPRTAGDDGRHAAGGAAAPGGAGRRGVVPRVAVAARLHARGGRHALRRPLGPVGPTLPRARA
jgi:hypothetical protein